MRILQLIRGRRALFQAVGYPQLAVHQSFIIFFLSGQLNCCQASKASATQSKFTLPQPRGKLGAQVKHGHYQEPDCTKTQLLHGDPRDDDLKGLVWQSPKHRLGNGASPIPTKLHRGIGEQR